MGRLLGRTGINNTIWLPTDIGGCVLWLRSDLGITKDGSDRVSQWADQSGNGNNFAQATDAAKPVWTVNQLGVYPGLVFDTVDDDLTNTDAGLCDIVDGLNSFIWFAVWKFNTTPTGTKQIFKWLVVADTSYYTHLEFRTAPNQVYWRRANYGDSYAANSTALDTNWHKDIFGHDGPNQLPLYRRDGSDVFTSWGVKAVSYNMGNTIDKIVLNNNTGGITLVEFGAYDNYISAPSKTLLESYITTRYGL